MIAITRHSTVLAFIGILWLAGCAVAPPALEVRDPPQESPKPFTFKKHPVLALVLGSGATRGFAHVGVLDVLDEYGIHPDMIVGASAGSVTGVLYAGGIRGEKLEKIAEQLQRDQVADWSYSGRGLIRGEALQKFINTLLKHRPIEKLDISFAATATDLQTGKQVVFTRGDAGLAVRTSSSIPGLVSPVTINGRDYIDGGVVSSVPVELARKLGADIVIAVDVSRPLSQQSSIDSTFTVVQQAIAIMSHKITHADIKQADIVIKPVLGNLSFGDFDKKENSIQAGKEAAIMEMPNIQKLLKEKHFSEK